MADADLGVTQVAGLQRPLLSRTYRPALTIEQIEEFTLPESVLKEDEARKGDWFHAFGHEQTEIDALAALRPDTLRRIAERWILKFYDSTLQQRVQRAEQLRWTPIVRQPEPSSKV
jgi:hypothetical protein